MYLALEYVLDINVCFTVPFDPYLHISMPRTRFGEGVSGLGWQPEYLPRFRQFIAVYSSSWDYWSNIMLLTFQFPALASNGILNMGQM